MSLNHILESRLSYLVEEINGNALCDDYFGTDENCVALTTMKDRLKRSGDQFEFNLWRFLLSFINLLTQIKMKNLWIEDLSGSNFMARVTMMKIFSRVFQPFFSTFPYIEIDDFSNPCYSYR